MEKSKLEARGVFQNILSLGLGTKCILNYMIAADNMFYNISPAIRNWIPTCVILWQLWLHLSCFFL